MDVLERIRLIETIIEKDLRIGPWVWISSVVIAGVGFFLLFPLAVSASSSPFRTTWVWFDPSLRAFYAMYAALTSLILGLTFATFHGGEVRKGSIRSVILYPVNMNDITIAKLVSSLVATAILSSILALGFFGGFFLLGVFPAGDFLALHATALAMSFLALAVGVFLAQGIAHLAGRMLVSPSAMGALFLLFAILLTETAVFAFGSQIALLSARIRGSPLNPEDFAVVESIAKALSVLSPHHIGARILGIVFGMTNMWADLHVVVPIAVLVLLGGYMFAKKIYLDIFIR